MTVLSLGAGVQSTALYLMACEGLLENYSVDRAIFADTQWEPKAVYDHLAKLQALNAIPIDVVTAGNIRSDALASKQFASMPLHVVNASGGGAMLRRHCTYDYKIAPIRKRIQELRGTARATVLIGISTDEAHRAKPADVKYLEHRWPLLEMGLKRAHCVMFLKSRGWDRVPKSSCIGCPYHDDSFWLDLRDNSPSEFMDAVDFDRRVRTATRIDGDAYLHRSKKPLDLVAFHHDGQQNLFDHECEGMCGL